MEDEYANLEKDHKRLKENGPIRKDAELIDQLTKERDEKD